MKRSLWKERLSNAHCPAWPCPVCRKESIRLVPKSLMHKETVRSKRAYGRDDWDPDWIEHTFTAWAECKHQSCKQQFAIAGVGGVTLEQTEEGDELVNYFVPMVCCPMPDMFDFPTKCPDIVKEELRAAFALFWSNQAACAGRIRVALECLMSHSGVQRRRKDKNGKYVDLTLHARIEAFSKREPNVGPHLMALKWLGNAGSHNGEVRKDDLLDAFEIMEHALGEIIDRRSAKVAALARKLTKKHGR